MDHTINKWCCILDEFTADEAVRDDHDYIVGYNGSRQTALYAFDTKKQLEEFLLANQVRVAEAADGSTIDVRWQGFLNNLEDLTLDGYTEQGP